MIKFFAILYIKLKYMKTLMCMKKNIIKSAEKGTMNLYLIVLCQQLLLKDNKSCAFLEPGQRRIRASAG